MEIFVIKSKYLVLEIFTRIRICGIKANTFVSNFYNLLTYKWNVVTNDTQINIVGFQLLLNKLVITNLFNYHLNMLSYVNKYTKF